MLVLLLEEELCRLAAANDLHQGADQINHHFVLDYDDDVNGIHPKYLRRFYLQVKTPQVYPPDFCHHHHHVGDVGFIVYETHCDGNVDDDDDLSVTLVSDDGILCNAPQVYPPDYFGKLFKKVSKRKINRVLR